MLDDAAARMFGYSREEDLLGKSMHELLELGRPDGSGHPPERSRILLSVRGGESRRVTDEVFRRSDGSSFAVDYRCHPVVEEGEVRGAVVVFTDVAERSRWEDDLELRSSAAEVLLAVAVAANEAPSPEEAIQVALDKVCEHSGFPVGCAYLLGEDDLGEVLNATGWHLEDAERFRPFRVATEEARLRRGEGVPGRVLVSGETEFVTDSDLLDGPARARAAAEVGLRGAFASPIRAGAEVIGVMEFLFAEELGPSHRWQQVVAQVSTQLAWAIERAQVRESLERHNTQVTLINEMGDLLQSCMTAEEGYEVVAEYAGRLFPGDSGALCIISASRSLVEATAVWGDRASAEAVFPPDSCWALRRGRVHVMESGSGQMCPHVVGRPAATVCVPMMAKGEALGLLYLRVDEPTAPHVRRLTADKQQLAVMVGDHVSLAIANFELRETLRVQSIRDPLTGLFNRRYMEETLERELRRAMRHEHALGLISMDIDHFKEFNDRLGHEAGDLLLRELGELLLGQIRSEDIACRVGGEEFMLILPEASLDVTIDRAEHLREQAEGMTINLLGKVVQAPTLSLGVAIFPHHGSSIEDLLRGADGALYRAKAEGRDRVAVAEPKVS